jgi:hypothetical protein
MDSNVETRPINAEHNQSPQPLCRHVKLCNGEHSFLKLSFKFILVNRMIIVYDYGKNNFNLLCCVGYFRIDFGTLPLNNF